MSTQVIIRFDDIRGPDLMQLFRWFDNKYPKIPCSVFALSTDTEWDIRSWQHARQCIEKRGWEIGGHTRNHPMLSQLSKPAIRTAIENNIADIESGLMAAGLDYSVETFAYPGGDHDDRVVAALKEIGIPNGLTFTDGFPYQSVDAVPTGEDRYRWGVTHNGSFSVEVWNERFDRVAERDGLYVLGLHPTYWDNGFVGPIRRYLHHDVSWSYLRRSLRRGIKRSSNSDQWSMLNKHIEHIKSVDDVFFTTFRACHG